MLICRKVEEKNISKCQAVITKQRYSWLAFSNFFFSFVLLLSVYGCFACMCGLCSIYPKTRRGNWVSWNWSHRGLQVIMQVLSITSGSSGRSASAPNHLASPPAASSDSFKTVLSFYSEARNYLHFPLPLWLQETETQLNYAFPEAGSHCDNLLLTRNSMRNSNAPSSYWKHMQMLPPPSSSSGFFGFSSFPWSLLVQGGKASTERHPVLFSSGTSKDSLSPVSRSKASG